MRFKDILNEAGSAPLGYIPLHLTVAEILNFPQIIPAQTALISHGSFNR